MCLDCPVGWASYNGECFHFSKSTASWLDAQAACRQMGGYLATDDNKEKHDFLTNIASVIHSFGETVFWLGGDDYLFEGVWRWEETGGPVVSFTKWAPGYPTNSSDTNCLGMVFVDTELMWKVGTLLKLSKYTKCAQHI
ncbi:hypothetical protein FSP39_002362 [Pinctada imbricata]|uniref:C-type lectin domain-containing protein n=1 Tax=Pinctada imbricata TaxID=66713 RepID=A0AA88XDF8_PINIB|nr:hypothetical protein FSP39_002362 [Pinctada imbricata]